jgi:hypothetical protein
MATMPRRYTTPSMSANKFPRQLVLTVAARIFTDAEPEALLNGAWSVRSISFRTGVQIATAASIFDRFDRLLFQCCERI